MPRKSAVLLAEYLTLRYAVFWRYATDIQAGKYALFSLEIAECGLSRGADLLVAVIGETFQRSNCRRRRGETECFDRRRAQRRRFPPEQATARLRELDERLHRRRTADPPERENELSLHRLILFLFHRDDERHRQRARLAAADAKGGLHAHLRGLVAQCAAQRLRRRARSDLRQRQGDRLPHTLVVVLELLGERRYGFIQAELTRQLGDVAHDKPLVMPQHMHQLVRPLFHAGQRHENAAPLLDGRRRNQEIQQHLDPVLPCPAQHEQGVLAVRGVIGHLRDRLEQRLAVHPLQRD